MASTVGRLSVLLASVRDTDDLGEVEMSMYVKLTVRDFRKINQSALIAMDGKDGKILFDTERNKEETCRKYDDGIIIAMWADIRTNNKNGFQYFYRPVIKCYVSHNSWK